MGAMPYEYFVQYEADIEAALQKLRQREFAAGRYNPAMRFIHFPADVAKPSPGAKHSSIEQAIDASSADGTRSILDIRHIGQKASYGIAVPLSNNVLEELYGTAKPTREMIEADMAFFEDLERGHAVYIITYKDNQPNEIFFAGYSYD